MASDVIQMNGVVTSVINNSTYKVKLQNNIEITAHVSGKMRLHRIQILQGDTVTVELSPYDLTCGRITFRGK
ncbi:translation initiation factor IF-1 [Candidatus Malacoplasma girerdii]|uniref:Translation initiation factor IF-1 n=1 Tax=Candidatus Malacoplasma girerdii TaxID=1318617 RepID=A0A097SSC2_9BACT|nr:translation initiation factor IF-1 [Candidatus Malacoplasma girerdii]ASJ89002.1 MAG: translation initiation factor IF-1 [Candidatus Malacoplasma girerdii]